MEFYCVVKCRHFVKGVCSRLTTLSSQKFKEDYNDEMECDRVCYWRLATRRSGGAIVSIAARLCSFPFTIATPQGSLAILKGAVYNTASGVLEMAEQVYM